MQNLTKKGLLLLSLFCFGFLKAQDSLKVNVKSNPVLFYEGYTGFAGANKAGWTAGVTGNYQFFKRDLITIRFSAFIAYQNDLLLDGPIVGIPVYDRNERIVDYGILFGKRWVWGGVSVSASIGASYNYHEYLEKIDENYYHREETFFGTPFEVNVKFFKKQKRRFRAYYGIIPATKKKVAFGRSIGLKFVANWSDVSYTGFGISLGLGTHKKY